MKRALSWRSRALKEVLLLRIRSRKKVGPKPHPRPFDDDGIFFS